MCKAIPRSIFDRVLTGVGRFDAMFPGWDGVGPHNGGDHGTVGNKPVNIRFDNTCIFGRVCGSYNKVYKSGRFTLEQMQAMGTFWTKPWDKGGKEECALLTLAWNLVIRWRRQKARAKNLFHVPALAMAA